MHRAYQPYYLYFHALGSSIDTSPVDDDVPLQDLVQHQPSPRNSSPTTINDPVSANEEAVAVPKKKKKPATANQLQRGAGNTKENASSGKAGTIQCAAFENASGKARNSNRPKNPKTDAQVADLERRNWRYALHGRRS